MALPQFTGRLTFLIMLCALMGLGIIIRLFQLQVHLADMLYARGTRNYLRIEKVISPRGAILDCKGRPLATNRPITTLYWQGTGNRTYTPEQKELLLFLETTLQKELQDLSLAHAEHSRKKHRLAQDIPFELLSKIVERYPTQENLEWSVQFKRYYPYKNSCAHILGYLGTITCEVMGQMGLEKIFETELKGNPGELLKTVNSLGHQLAQQEIKAAIKGADLATTLDLDLHILAEEVFPQEYAGVFLIMEARTGALRVMISNPTFDPNMFVDSFDEEQWQKLHNDQQPFLNRLCNALYPPASLFKLITMSAALELGLVSVDSQWCCNGHTTFAGREYHCHKTHGHGPISTMQAIAKSCNIPFYDIGRRIKIDTLAEYAHRFGLGEHTGSVFPEKSGLIPTAHWKRHTKGEPWWPGETLSAAIGQSFLLVTPLQIVRMVSGICEGYLVKPRILVAEPLDTAPLAISSETLNLIKQSMCLTVKGGGTGQRLSHGDMDIYAKTGTAQTSALSKNTLGKEFREHAWLVAYIRYRDYEPLTMLILLEHASTSRVATAVAQNFLRKYRALYKNK